MRHCKLCLQKRKLVKAHSIPEAFFRKLRSGGVSPLIVSTVKGNFTKRSPIGIYDEGILCEVCEPTFGSTDEYGIEVLLNQFGTHFHALERDGALVGFESNSVDSLRLLQFLVAVLWRASVSTHSFYTNVNLGKYEDLASNFLAGGEDVFHVFDAVISKWHEEGENVPTTAILDPRREELLGVNTFRIYFGEVVAYVKVDSQSFNRKLQAISLRGNPKVLVVGRVMSKSNDYRALITTAKLSNVYAAGFRNAPQKILGAE